MRHSSRTFILAVAAAVLPLAACADPRTRGLRDRAIGRVDAAMAATHRAMHDAEKSL